MVASDTHLIGPSVPQLEERLFGRYELLCHVATGGMAHIYVARPRGVHGLQELVAIKRIHDDHAEDERFIQMFIDEAIIASKIAHPNVVHVLELGRVEDVYFIAMEYIHGESLHALMRRARLSLTASAYVVASSAAGLHAAHELRDESGMLLDVVHRDVSPQNILVGYDGTVKVTDFGVARARDQLHVTLSGAIKGKYSYMSPEQTQARAVDRRTDIFSLGVVLYELTTHRRLFRGANQAETLQRVRQMAVPRPSELIRHYPPQLEQIVLRSLERDPARRYETADEAQQELEQYLAAAQTQPGQWREREQLQALMHTTFSKRIVKRERILHAARQATQVVDADQTPSTPSGPDAGASASAGSIEDRTMTVHATRGSSEVTDENPDVLAVAPRADLSPPDSGSPPPGFGSGRPSTGDSPDVSKPSSRLGLIWSQRRPLIGLLTLLAVAAAVAVIGSILSQRQARAPAVEVSTSEDAWPAVMLEVEGAAGRAGERDASEAVAQMAAIANGDRNDGAKRAKRTDGGMDKVDATTPTEAVARRRAPRDPRARRAASAPPEEARRPSSGTKEGASGDEPRPKIETLDDEGPTIMTLD